MLRAGLRSSSYGAGEPFPKPVYWLKTTRAMASAFPAASPAVVWIVSVINFQGDSGIASLNFPVSLKEKDNYPDIHFADSDQNEEYLDQFDREGVKVWLQVEPGDTDVSTLIDLVLSRYSSHPCVVGFGVDVEWLKWNKNKANEGVAVTDAEARAWIEKVHAYNSGYGLFLKHWLVEKMPPIYREGITFLNDSQQFTDLDDMVAEFTAWGKEFAQSKVGFQFGYEADKAWWSGLSDPPRDIGQTLLKNIPNTTDLYWVDFTMQQIWPRGK